jgi:MFS superfamily sulfate permease-like transporter
MSAPPRDTASQYSKGVAALRGAFSRVASGIAGAPNALRWALCAVGLAGAILLIISEFSVVTHVKVITVVLPGTEVTGFDQNDGAMLILGLVSLPMLYGSGRAGSRPAMAAVALLGLVALLIALIGDLPDVTKVGTIVRERYEDAKAEPQAGFYLETLGAVLLLIAGGALLLVSGPAQRVRRRTPEPDSP